MPVDEAMKKVQSWTAKLTDGQYTTLRKTVESRLRQAVKQNPDMDLSERKKRARKFACEGASKCVDEVKEQEREAERKALPTEGQMMNFLGCMGLPQEGPAATITDQVASENRMELEEKFLMRAKEARLQEYARAYDLFPKGKDKKGKNGLILTRDPNRGAINRSVFDKEKECLVRLGAIAAKAERFLNITVAELRRQLDNGGFSDDESDFNPLHIGGDEM